MAYLIILVEKWPVCDKGDADDYVYRKYVYRDRCTCACRCAYSQCLMWYVTIV